MSHPWLAMSHTTGRKPHWITVTCHSYRKHQATAEVELQAAISCQLRLHDVRAFAIPISSGRCDSQKARYFALFIVAELQIIMIILSIILASLPFSIPADAYIVAPQSITVEQLAATPLSSIGSGISISLPETVNTYVMSPIYLTRIIAKICTRALHLNVCCLLLWKKYGGCKFLQD